MEKLCFENKSFKNFTYDLITSITLHMHLLRHNKKKQKIAKQCTAKPLTKRSKFRT